LAATRNKTISVQTQKRIIAQAIKAKFSIKGPLRISVGEPREYSASSGKFGVADFFANKVSKSKPYFESDGSIDITKGHGAQAGVDRVMKSTGREFRGYW